MLVLDLARCDYINAHDNIITLGNSGTGKTLDGRSPMTACWAPV